LVSHPSNLSRAKVKDSVVVLKVLKDLLLAKLNMFPHNNKMTRTGSLVVLHPIALAAVSAVLNSNSPLEDRVLLRDSDLHHKSPQPNSKEVRVWTRVKGSVVVARIILIPQPTIEMDLEGGLFHSLGRGVAVKGSETIFPIDRLMGSVRMLMRYVKQFSVLISYGMRSTAFSDRPDLA
jgi:hypothetical protein